MAERDWFDYVIGSGQVATPILLLVFTALGWRIRNRIERQAKLEEALRTERIAIYNDILDPFTPLLMSEQAWKTDPKNAKIDKDALALRQLLSADYRRLGFRLALIGSDSVVRAYNNLMQFFFEHAHRSAGDPSMVPRRIMALLGSLLLEIRRSTGNESTNLDNWEMLEWFVMDARKMRQP